MTNQVSTEVNATASKRSLVAKFADKYGVEPAKLMETLKKAVFKQEGITNEQMMALMVVADQYSLNPFTKEIYAFPDKGSIVPVVGVDGWTRIINEHPQNDGVEFVYSDETVDAGGKKVPAWIEVVIHRKDRSVPTRVREYFEEVKRNTQPWNSHPSRMLRHKALIQAARVAFGFSGIYDEDEAERIRDVTPKKEEVSQTLDALNNIENVKPIIEIDVADVVSETTEEYEQELFNEIEGEV